MNVLIPNERVCFTQAEVLLRYNGAQTDSLTFTADLLKGIYGVYMCVCVHIQYC